MKKTGNITTLRIVAPSVRRRSAAEKRKKAKKKLTEQLAEQLAEHFSCANFFGNITTLRIVAPSASEQPDS